MSNDMLEGYRDGVCATEPDFPERLANWGASYRHGWLNGRDDRLRNPRAIAADLREAAKEAEKKDAFP